MPIQEHEPLPESTGTMSEEKRKWWDGKWQIPNGLKQTRKALFHHAMNTTPRPTSPDEAIEYGYVTNNKFHDREPEAVVNGMLAVDPHFFNSYPRRETTQLNKAFLRAVIGEAARAFYRHGFAAYGKPDLRKPSNNRVRTRLPGVTGVTTP